MLTISTDSDILEEDYERSADMKYAIFEGNMERLEKKLIRIKNKCDKYGIEFKYEKCGEEFRTLKDENGEDYTAKFIIVEAEGKAVQNGWEFVATLEHHESGNIIKGYGEHEVPERYYNCEAICEHCNSKRKRKDTYIVYNAELDAFKQVGKSCLKDFTFGLDAEQITAYMSGFDELVKGEEPWCGSNHDRYYEIEEMLCYFNETIKHFGYVRSADLGESSASKALKFYNVNHRINVCWMTDKEIEFIKREMASVNFDADTEKNRQKAKDMVAWVLANDNDNNYFHNLKVVCSSEYVSSSNFGILASLPASYDKNLEKEAERRQRELERQAENAKGMCSEYVGNVGDRIEIEIESVRCLSTRYSQFGATYFMKIVGKDGNIYMWSTSNGLIEDAKRIKATVKEHQEYNGVKQTVITRGKVLEEKKSDDEEHPQGTWDGSMIDEYYE